jgi:MFS family permease
LLAGAFGSGVALAVDAATYVVLTAAAALVRTRRAPERATVDESSRARSGFAILRSDPVLAPLLAGVALVLLLVGMVDVVLVYLVREALHAGGIWYGVTEAAWMAGIVVGAVAAGGIGSERGRIRATIGGAALACAAVACFAVAPAVWILVPISVLGGVGNGYAASCMSTLLMSRTPDSARGRVSAAANAILNSAQGAALLLGGVVAIALSPQAIAAVAGLLGLAAAGVVAVAAASPTADRSTLSAPQSSTL